MCPQPALHYAALLPASVSIVGMRVADEWWLSARHRERCNPDPFPGCSFGLRFPLLPCLEVQQEVQCSVRSDHRPYITVLLYLSRVHPGPEPSTLAGHEVRLISVYE